MESHDNTAYRASCGSQLGATTAFCSKCGTSRSARNNTIIKKILSAAAGALLSLGLAACVGPQISPYQPLLDAAHQAYDERNSICFEASDQIIESCASAAKPAMQAWPPKDSQCLANVVLNTPACRPTANACLIAAANASNNDQDVAQYWEHTCWTLLVKNDPACHDAQARLDSVITEGKQTIDEDARQQRIEDFIAAQNRADRFAARSASRQSYIAEPFGNSTLVRPWP